MKKLILLILFFCLYTDASAQTLDLTTFKHTNDTGTITLTKSKIDYTSSGQGTTSYVKKHTLSGDFLITGEFSSTPTNASHDPLYNAFMVSATEFDFAVGENNYLSMFVRRDASDNLIVRSVTVDSLGGVDTSDLIISSATTYYFEFERAGATLTVKLFTDEDRQTQHGTTQTLTAQTDTMNWIYPYQTYSTPGDRGYTGYTSNIQIAQSTVLGIKTPDLQTTNTSETITGITTASLTVGWVNSLGGTGSTTADSAGNYTITPSLALGINVITVSVSGQSDEIIDVERVSDYSQEIETATIDTVASLPVEGVYSIENNFDGEFHQTFYGQANNGNIYAMLGKDAGSGLAFKDRQDTGVSGGYWPGKHFSVQDTYYSSWHACMFMYSAGYSFRPVKDDDTTYALWGNHRGGAVASTVSDRANISGVYAEDGYVSSLYYNSSNKLVINRTSNSSTLTSMTTVIDVETYTDTALELRNKLIEFSNSDLGACYAYDGELTYKHWDKTSLSTEIAITTDLCDINNFRVFRDNEDNVFFVYRKLDGSLNYKKLTNFVSLSAEIPILDYVDSFQASCDMSKESAFYVFYSLDNTIYFNSVVSDSLGQFWRELVTDLDPGTYMSAPYFEADEIGLQYKNTSGHRLIAVVPTNKTPRSTTGNFIGYCRPDNGFSSVVALKDTGLEESFIYYNDRSDYGKASIYDHNTDTLTEDGVIVTGKRHDKHNRSKAAMNSDNMIWIAGGGSDHGLEEYPIEVSSFDYAFNSTSFDLTAISSMAAPVLGEATSYKGLIPVGTEMYFW